MKIILWGNPAAKARHRCGCNRNKPYPYDPQIKDVMKGIKKEMKAQAELAKGFYLPYSRSLTVQYTFVLPISKSASISQKNAFKWGLSPHTSKPDRDNLMKIYDDCGTGILWSDDAIINRGEPIKIHGDNPRVEITITENTMQLDKRAQQVLMVFGPEELKEFLRDVTAFWSMPAERVDSLMPMGEEIDKTSILSATTSVLIEFAHKHADNLKKIKKLKDS